MIRKSCQLLVTLFVGIGFMLISTTSSQAQFPVPCQINWQRLPELPAPFGVAGPFVGVCQDTLLVAGGANFPEGVPWHPTASGGISLKQFHREIYTLRKAQPGGVGPKQYVWSTTSAKLPKPIGYGVSVSTDQGILCIGGEWQEYTNQLDSKAPTTTLLRSDDVYLMTWNPNSQSAAVKREWQYAGKKLTLPKLPKPTTAACGAIVNGYVYLAGGDCGEGGNNQFLRLSLRPENDKSWNWETVPTWDGPPRTHALAVEQAGRFFLIGGRNKIAEHGLSIHSDAHCFDPASLSWKRLSDVRLQGESQRSVMAGTVTSIGRDHICVFGGAEADIILLREQVYPAKIAEAKARGESERAAQLQVESDALYDNHQGFSRDILTYSLSTDSWSLSGRMPVTSPVTTTAVKWGNMIVIPSGEERPGVRTQAVWGITFSE